MEAVERYRSQRVTIYSTEGKSNIHPGYAVTSPTMFHGIIPVCSTCTNVVFAQTRTFSTRLLCGLPTTAVYVLLGHSNIRHAALLVVAPFGQACVRLPRIRSRRQRTLFENASGRSRWRSTPFPRLSPRGTSGWYDVQCCNCPPFS